MDIRALAEVTMKHVMPKMMKGEPVELDADRINADLARIPEEPDEELR